MKKRKFYLPFNKVINLTDNITDLERENMVLAKSGCYMSLVANISTYHGTPANNSSP